MIDQCVRTDKWSADGLVKTFCGSFVVADDVYNIKVQEMIKLSYMSEKDAQFEYASVCPGCRTNMLIVALEVLNENNLSDLIG